MASYYKYQVELSHPGLNKYKVIKASSKSELQMRIDAQNAQWAEQWTKKLAQRKREAERQAKRAEREAQIKSDEDSLRYASELTQQANDVQQALNRLVVDRVKEPELDINTLKDFSKYPEKKPTTPKYSKPREEPLRTDEKYNPAPSFFTKLSKKKMREFEDSNKDEFDKDHNIWLQEKNRIDLANEAVKTEYQNQLKEWEQKKAEFEEAQEKSNTEIEQFFDGFQKGDAPSVERYTALLLGDIEFPIDYYIDGNTEYVSDNKRLIVDALLPTVEDIPKLKSVSYIKTRKEFKESYYPESYIRKMYDNVIYQIVLLCLDAVFYIGNKYDLIESVVVNGRVDTIDKATGKRIQPCILSLAIDKTAYLEVNIDAVDPKTWFKSAKGVSAASMAAITPVAPIISVSHEDSRFIEGYSVAENLDDGVNLAAIDWQDFENLIRELFEKEFSENGGEVKITQASRDGGVDAVAFDPDPIRGGKIVIQAKRYTNVVGVSAVRDLYGTVVNEGANKGILVTTSNYGNDAYSFAQGKPLTLMNGANLLYLLEKHGYKARIDLKEAKEMQQT